jgi:peptidoglycan/xylan/chitin deacetylase (PgdA/CDA1 family)
MRRVWGVAYAFAFLVSVSPALAGECANPKALGTSRTLVIDTAHPRLGAQQYAETLPLRDREVVLTFDDGPLAPYTTKILDLLAAECVKATYFLVGQMAQSNPDLVQRIARDGHTIGTHSMNHPLTFDSMGPERAEREIDRGIAAVKAALGKEGQLAPFFRIPGLLRSSTVEGVLQERSLVTWSVDLVADDWHRITAKEIAQRALRRLDARGRGILLLHDIQPATALAMPMIFKGLKEGGYRVVHVVPAGPNRPKTYSEPQQWASYGNRAIRARMEVGSVDPRRPVPSRASLTADHVMGTRSIAPLAPLAEVRHVMAAAGEEMRLPRGTWPQEDGIVMADHIAPSAPGVASTDWPQQDHLTAIVSFEDAIWPAVTPISIAEPKPEAEKKAAVELPRKKTKTASQKKSKSTKSAAASCKGASGAARCKKLQGHQLSFTRDLPPGSLRSQYSF